VDGEHVERLVATNLGGVHGADWNRIEIAGLQMQVYGASRNVVVGVDTRNWKITRILLSTNEPNGNENTVAYQILHLARPLLDTLPKGDDR
jgi:uncharacterized protein with von Willebrand factor type A (vWA) domain